LHDLKTRIFAESIPEGLPFSYDAETLSRSNLWNLVTDAGRLALIFKPSGTQGYDDLARSAVTFDVFGVEVRAASLKDILRSKLTSNRPQDQQDVIVLREMLKRNQSVVTLVA
jgi:hypothetical protein